LAIIFLKRLNRGWWELRWIRSIAYLIPIFGGICILLWAIGVQLNFSSMHAIGASGAALTVVIQIAMLLSLPISGTAQFLVRKIGGKIENQKEPDPNRRVILKAAAGIFPLAAITAGVDGVARSFGPVKMPEIKMRFANLPQSLDGFKILQISDMHLGYYVILEDLEKMLTKAQEEKPDLVLITGDMADDLTALPYALRMISQLQPPYGTYACLGNHEYYRGIRQVMRDFNNSPIPVLVSQGMTVDIDDDTQIYVAGADDPRYLSRMNTGFVKKTVHESLNGAPEGAFRILMCHRPQGYDYAADLGAELTLSGHTHGGQIGIAHRSVFEEILPYKYLWGHYIKENGSQLYTTSGMGHWFPFRLGCPQEVPLIVLERG
jgi:predicted MPP superfamily phosphohydrolase